MESLLREIRAAGFSQKQDCKIHRMTEHHHSFAGLKRKHLIWLQFTFFFLGVWEEAFPKGTASHRVSHALL